MNGAKKHHSGYSEPFTVSGSHSLIVMLTNVPIARVDLIGSVLSTRMWNLPYSKIRLNILNMVPLGFHATHHTHLALVPSQMQMRRGKLNMDYKQMYKQKKQFNSLCVICTTLSLATSTKK